MTTRDITPIPEDELERAGKMTGHAGAFRTVKGLRKSRILTGPRAPRPSGRPPIDGTPAPPEGTEDT